MFSYDGYIKLISEFKQEGYSFIYFTEESESIKQIILRHDIDNSIESALRLARIEHELGVKSTYFVLLGTDFYNPFSLSSKEMMKEIINLGHSIGLHFDCRNYRLEGKDGLLENIRKELGILSNIIDMPVNVVSFHRPIKEYIGISLADDIISTYEKRYFYDFKYISDSRMKWHDNPFEAIRQGMEKIQLLTHAVWYGDAEASPRERINQMKNEKKVALESALVQNFTDYKSLMEEC